MSQTITSGVGTTPRIIYLRGSTAGDPPTTGAESGQSVPNTQEGGKAADNHDKNAASSDPSRGLMEEAARMSKGVRSRLRPENILVDGKVVRWPALEGVDKAVHSEWWGRRFPAVRRQVIKSLINERRGFGNCGEMSTAVLRELVDYLWKNKMTSTRVDAIQLGDHEFVAVNPPQPDDKGRVSTDFSQWPTDSIIVDPWMEIVCPAGDYPNALRAKAEEWAGENKTIGTSEMVFKDGRMTFVEKVVSPQEFVESVLNGNASTVTYTNAPDNLEKLKNEIELGIQWLEDEYAKRSK
ncbi:hypothetical protein OV203_25435 [Nannocystis sp. ILAH1]|uniref:hypothetical protein n=1 Tax=Nannocystis sp. ILAH1 TaxID=2996789 RepID=UPI002271BBE7|nr:hypothetical protein [Nannocystis sp. ILAH1]MCY0990510.1 hypothetical protein [Nannocystis sp. ILAH1]